MRKQARKGKDHLRQARASSLDDLTVVPGIGIVMQNRFGNRVDMSDVIHRYAPHAG